MIVHQTLSPGRARAMIQALQVKGADGRSQWLIIYANRWGILACAPWRVDWFENEDTARAAWAMGYEVPP